MTALDDRVARCRRILLQHRDLLLDMPHPDRRRASEGHKMRGKVQWLLDNAGATGRTRACKIIEEALRRRQEPDMLRGHPSVAKRS